MFSHITTPGTAAPVKQLAQTGTTPAWTKFTAVPFAEISRAHIISAAVAQAIAVLLAFWSGAV